MRTYKTSYLGKKLGQKGFTLIELLIVIALIAISVGVTSDVLMSLLRSYNKSTAMHEVEQEANFIGLKLEKELRNASGAVSPTPNRLEFDYNGVTVYYNADPGTKNLYRSTSGYSTNNANALVATKSLGQTIGGVELECLGNCFTLSGTVPEVIDISMLVKQAAGSGVSYTGNIHIKNTIVLRNTY